MQPVKILLMHDAMIFLEKSTEQRARVMVIMSCHILFENFALFLVTLFKRHFFGLVQGMYPYFEAFCKS